MAAKSDAVPRRRRMMATRCGANDQHRHQEQETDGPRGQTNTVNESVGCHAKQPKEVGGGDTARTPVRKDPARAREPGNSRTKFGNEHSTVLQQSRQHGNMATHSMRRRRRFNRAGLAAREAHGGEQILHRPAPEGTAGRMPDAHSTSDSRVPAVFEGPSPRAPSVQLEVSGWVCQLGSRPVSAIDHDSPAEAKRQHSGHRHHLSGWVDGIATVHRRLAGDNAGMDSAKDSEPT